MRHRERVSDWIVPQAHYQYRVYCSKWYDSGKVPTLPFALRREYCDDELHQGPPYKSGGPLDLWKYSCGSPWGPSYTMNSTSTGCQYSFSGYQGRLYVHPPPEFSGFRDPDWGDASDHGATGWNKYKPAKPGVDLGVALAEMRETFGSIKKRLKSFKDLYDGRRKVPTNLAGNFLEANFGWLPLVSDIQKAIDTYSSLDDLIGRIRKYNGQWEHRGGPVNKQEESWEQTFTGTSALSKVAICTDSYFHPADLIAQDTVVDTYRYTSNSWFEGAFRYYIPDIDTPEWAAKARRKLFGLDLNPSLVWELIPWSWLVDWISNAGDVFSNLDNGLAENLTAAYAYIMRTTTYSINRTATIKYLSVRSPLTPSTITHSVLSTWTRKNRVAASPFGFGIDFGSFSPKQIAIMAALGLSK